MVRRLPAGWKSALWHAMPVSLFVLGLFYYWFAVADRYAIFLYEHLGATPFDAVTGSRYWMSGLVASGMVMVAYTLINWLLGRSRPTYRPPRWWQVWALCVPPLAVGIPLITMTANHPTLPPGYAAACVGATLVGSALALAPGSWAAQQPVDLGWLIFDGAGLMPVFMLLRAVELPARGLVSVPVAYLFALGGMLAAALWFGMMTGLRRWRHKSQPSAGSLLAAGLGLSYLLLPVVHHFGATPPDYRYISTASNFFAFNLWLQLVVLLVAALLAMGITQLRRKWQ